MRFSLLLGLASALSLQASVAVAKPKYGMAGCGLGTLVIKDNTKMQVLAATTNGTSGSQTFGITTGTSNCSPADKMAQQSKQEAFIMANLNVLHKEMARGEGDTLKAFAATLGCSEQSYQTFAHVTQASYGDIMRAPGAIAVLEKTKDTLRAQPEMAAACNGLI